VSTARVAVVAAVVERDGRYLLGRRPVDKRHGDLWEFPGGKVDDGESALEATRRELAEELDVAVTEVGALMHEIADTAPPFVIFFHGAQIEGEPRAIEHTDVGWFTLEELLTMALAPADERFVAWLATAGRPVR